MASRTLLTALCVACSGGVLSLPAAEIKIPPLEVTTGSSTLVLASLDSRTQSISALQFDLEYDASLFQIGVAVAESIRTSEKNLFVADLAPNRKRILVYGLNQNVINDGALFKVFININPEASAGVYTISFAQAVASDLIGRAVPLEMQPMKVTVQAGQGIPLVEEGILNAASQLPGPLAPGELITLIGSSIGPGVPLQPDIQAVETNLGGVRVLFDGIAAPLLYAAPSQINVMAPLAIATKDHVLLETETAGTVRSSITLPVSLVSPGLFTEGGTGTGQSVARNEDGSMNGPLNPAPRGSIVTILATGTGQLDEMQRPFLTVSARIGGVIAEVIEASATSTVILAVTQVKCRVPENVQPGAAIPIVLEIGSRSSQPGVFLAIQ